MHGHSSRASAGAPVEPGVEPEIDSAVDQTSAEAALEADTDALRHHLAAGALSSPEHVETWSIRFGLLGDTNRLRIMLALHRAPGITVGALAAAVGMSDNAASHALSALRTAGLVTASRDGRYRRWSVADSEVHEILHAVGAGHSTLHTHH